MPAGRGRGPVVGDEVGIERTPPVAGLSAVALSGGASGPLSRQPDLEAEASAAPGGSVFEEWWFWTAVGVGAVALAGGSYLIFAGDREPTSGTMYVVW
jgi:hypothetical protein